MLWVTDEEDTLDTVGGSAGETLQGVDGGGGTLGVTLKDEAVVGVRVESRSDTVDNVGSACRRVLRERSGVDSVVDLSTRELRGDSRVHRLEAGRLALGLTSASGVEESVPGARGGDRSLGKDGRGGGGGNEDKGGEEGLKHFGKVWEVWRIETAGRVTR